MSWPIQINPPQNVVFDTLTVALGSGHGVRVRGGPDLPHRTGSVASSSPTALGRGWKLLPGTSAAERRVS